ncbi:hypothetical protein [Curtobacterium sp. MCBA15_001]|uniref:hypothetical protein n=1 Tax=Curtobacterium sp. MCBA15_001 TaxID=1898731 RepID=UPI00111404EC|nr:hypothetical protein [Curtobacterium sp. MCBA15_001]
MSGALGVSFLAVGASAETTWAAVAAPVAMLFCVGVHETAHLVAVRVLVGPGRGAVICSSRVVAVLHPAVCGYRARLIASAGPVAGAVFAVAYWTLRPGDVVSQYTASVLLVVNLFGLIPLSTDGKVLLHGSTTTLPSGKHSA